MSDCPSAKASPRMAETPPLASSVRSAVWTVGEAFQRWADSPCELELRDDGDAAWRDRHGHWHQTSVASGGYVSPWLIVVPVAGSGWRRKWIVILPDAASRDDRRRLRVWLRWRPGKNTPDGE